jgi:5-formyltetrahydrofolate cyclo-ligase
LSPEEFIKYKSEFRKGVRAKIAEYSAEELVRSDEQIADRFLSLPEIGNCKRVWAYVNYGKEISTMKILSYFRKAGIYVAVCWDFPPDRFPQAGEIIIVPGLTFDENGYRIGKGGGYYDRLIAASPDSFTVGLARDGLVVGEVPKEAHDQRVQCLVTETKITRYQ